MDRGSWLVSPSAAWLPYPYTQRILAWAARKGIGEDRAFPWPRFDGTRWPRWAVGLIVLFNLPGIALTIIDKPLNINTYVLLAVVIWWGRTLRAPGVRVRTRLWFRRARSRPWMGYSSER